MPENISKHSKNLKSLRIMALILLVGILVIAFTDMTMANIPSNICDITVMATPDFANNGVIVADCPTPRGCTPEEVATWSIFSLIPPVLAGGVLIFALSGTMRTSEGSEATSVHSGEQWLGPLILAVFTYYTALLFLESTVL